MLLFLKILSVISSLKSVKNALDMPIMARMKILAIIKLIYDYMGIKLKNGWFPLIKITQSTRCYLYPWLNMPCILSLDKI